MNSYSVGDYERWNTYGRRSRVTRAFEASMRAQIIDGGLVLDPTVGCCIFYVSSPHGSQQEVTCLYTFLAGTSDTD